MLQRGDARALTAAGRRRTRQSDSREAEGTRRRQKPLATGGHLRKSPVAAVPLLARTLLLLSTKARSRLKRPSTSICSGGGGAVPKHRAAHVRTCARVWAH